MRKAIAWALGLILALSALGASAEEAASPFEALAGIEWTFCSGVGGWSTDLRIQPDGSFSGEYHDSEMGECAEEYPYGTIYCCSFTGQMVFVEQVNENTRKIRIDRLQVDESQEKESIGEGIRFVACEPYGLSEGDEMLLYRPGTPVSVFSEDMLLWAHVSDRENPPAELDTWFLSSEKNDSGFVGYEVPAVLSLPNPWEDMTAEQLKEASGLVFGVPEGAKNVIWRYLRSENLAEMQFTLDGDEFCARIRPSAPGEDGLTDISGMYYVWENVEAVAIRGCPGTIGQARDGSEGWVELCQWYDAASGLTYSLSVSLTDPDGFDLTAVAEQVCVPAREDS